jgi:hypothetical protein
MSLDHDDLTSAQETSIAVKSIEEPSALSSVPCVDAPTNASKILFGHGHVVERCRVSGLKMRLHTPQALMEVRRSGPSRLRALKALRHGLVFPIPFFRPFAHKPPSTRHIR